MPLVPGTRVGSYEILSSLGAGGMGEVYRARDTRLQRDLAIKVLPASVTTEERLRRLQQEACAASALNHPNVLAIYDVGNADGTFFIAAEFVPGETLRARMDRSLLSLAEVDSIAPQIAAGLAAAHAAGIVHRDVKPENVMLRTDGLVKLVDFGIAKQSRRSDREDTIEATKTADHAITGTVKYMSPEQARGLTVDARSDVFSFGVVLYEMLTRRVPHDGATTTDVMVAILERTPPPIATLRPDAPTALQQLVSRCLEKDVARRPASARELVNAFVERTRAGHDTSLAGRQRSAVAVLPFVNMSADRDNEYFCDGLAEELIDRLTKIDNLRVAARGSTFRFKQQRADIRDIGRTLNVTAVLDGSVRKAGSRIRVAAQLVNVADGLNLWSEKYDRTLEDIFAIQDEIARAIAGALEVNFTGRSHTAADGSRAPEDVEAYTCYLKGRFCRNKWTPDAFREGIGHYEQALARQPSYALAAAGMAEIYALMGVMGWLHPDTAWPKAKAAAERALALDRSLAPAHGVLGGALWQYERDWAGAERAFRRAIEENAAYPITYEWYGFFLMCLQRTEEGVRVLQKMRDLDPLSPMYNSLYGCGLWYARRYDEAIAQLKIALDMDPGVSVAWTHYMLGLSYERTGAFDEAVAMLERTCAMGVPAHAWLAYTHARAGRTADAERILAELTARGAQAYVPAYEFALVHVGLEQHDTALEWLEKAIDERNAWTLHCARALPHFDPLRGHPRFTAFVRRLGLDP